MWLTSMVQLAEHRDIKHCATSLIIWAWVPQCADSSGAQRAASPSPGPLLLSEVFWHHAVEEASQEVGWGACLSWVLSFLGF